MHVWILKKTMTTYFFIHTYRPTPYNNNINNNVFVVVIVVDDYERASAYLNMWSGIKEEERLKEVFGRERERERWEIEQKQQQTNKRVEREDECGEKRRKGSTQKGGGTMEGGNVRERMKERAKNVGRECEEKEKRFLFSELKGAYVCCYAVLSLPYNAHCKQTRSAMFICYSCTTLL